MYRILGLNRKLTHHEKTNLFDGKLTITFSNSSRFGHGNRDVDLSLLVDG